MTLGEQGQGTLIGIPEIAEVAGVQRTAVSNWRKRSTDFPTPVVETPSGVLFDLSEIETWLIENGKIASRVPIAPILWRTLDALRGDLVVEEFGRFINAALVYLEVCERAETGRISGITSNLLWSDIRTTKSGSLVDALRSAASKIEEQLPEFRGLMVGGFTFKRQPTSKSVVQVLDLLERVSGEGDSPRFALFEEMRQRTVERDRFSQEWTTPNSLEFLLAGLTSGASSLFDPACGEGGVLLMAAVIDGGNESSSRHRLIGRDINSDACQLARTRFFLYDVEADIETTNSLQEPPPPNKVEAVVLDPPYSMRDWGDAPTYISERWRYGSPPPSSADMAWLQVALEALAEQGRAFVLLPPSSLFRSGRDELIRRALLKAGVIEAIALLPARLRRDTSIPLALWCLRAEGTRDVNQPVLLVDASRLGSAGRSTIDLEESEIDTLVELLQSWSSDEIFVTGPNITAVEVSPDALIESGTLNPTRFFETELVELDVLSAARNEALANLLAAEKQARSAMAALLDAFGGDQ